VEEDTLYRASVVRVRSKRRIPARGLRALGQLLRGRKPGVLFKRGKVAAPFARVFRFPPRRMQSGYYVLATLLQAEMNTSRTKVFASRPFRVTTPKAKPPRKLKPKAKRRH
jgi:hypothetical protein